MAMSQQEYDQNRRASDPGRGSAAITTSDTTVYSPPILSLYVTVAGNVVFVGLDGNTDTWTVPANFIIPVAMTKVMATNTTATGLHGIY